MKRLLLSHNCTTELQLCRTVCAATFEIFALLLVSVPILQHEYSQVYNPCKPLSGRITFHGIVVLAHVENTKVVLNSHEPHVLILNQSSKLSDEL